MSHLFFFARQLAGIVATEPIKATGPLGDEAPGSNLAAGTPVQGHRRLGPSPRMLPCLEAGPVISELPHDINELPGLRSTN